MPFRPNDYDGSYCINCKQPYPEMMDGFDCPNCGYFDDDLIDFDDDNGNSEPNSAIAVSESGSLITGEGNDVET